jgi:hypothetical protein
MAQVYNSSYSGGRDQENQGLKPAQANLNLCLKNIQHKKGLVVWLKV